MKHSVLVLSLVACWLLSSAQKADSTAKDLFPHHFIAANPVVALWVQQEGLYYEYRYKRFGLGVTIGYIFPSFINFSRFFIARTVNYGSFEYYQGVFVNPQVNFYLKNPSRLKKRTIGFVAVKGVYKYLYDNGKDFHLWYSTDSPDADLFRKQQDRCHIGGVFALIGMKHRKGHFFLDLSAGPGFLAQKHNLVIMGEGSRYGYQHPSALFPPYEDSMTRLYFTVSCNFTVGVAF